MWRNTLPDLHLSRFRHLACRSIALDLLVYAVMSSSLPQTMTTFLDILHAHSLTLIFYHHLA